MSEFSSVDPSGCLTGCFVLMATEVCHRSCVLSPWLLITLYFRDGCSCFCENLVTWLSRCAGQFSLGPAGDGSMGGGWGGIRGRLSPQPDPGWETGPSARCGMVPGRRLQRHAVSVAGSWGLVVAFHRLLSERATFPFVTLSSVECVRERGRGRPRLGADSSRLLNTYCLPRTELGPSVGAPSFAITWSKFHSTLI